MNRMSTARRVQALKVLDSWKSAGVMPHLGCRQDRGRAAMRPRSRAVAGIRESHQVRFSHDLGVGVRAPQSRPNPRGSSTVPGAGTARGPCAGRQCIVSPPLTVPSPSASSTRASTTPT